MEKSFENFFWKILWIFFSWVYLIISWIMKWGVTFDSQLEIITSYTSCQLFESLFSLCCCDSESVQYKHMLLTLTNTTNCRTNIRFVAASRQKPRRMKLPFLFLLPPSLLLVKEISWIVNNVWSQVFQGDSWGGGGCWSATVLLSPWTKLKKTTKSRLLSWIRCGRRRWRRLWEWLHTVNCVVFTVTFTCACDGRHRED